jgi:hypothetical protein
MGACLIVAGTQPVCWIPVLGGGIFREEGFFVTRAFADNTLR